MTEAYRCPKCEKVFNDIESYKNHTCRSTILGGASDLREAKKDIEKGGTGGGLPP